ncbi:uncharacterized protein LOC134277448, partial [Saccostrea cucullata]|uniref:uncharacterized protein LOC134277448 n=1 Tax=Saccostrea cuccullata TaxID=36930 RepID=UPI002ED26BB3
MKYLAICVFMTTYSMQQSDVHLPLQCVIIQKRQAIVPPQRVPQFLVGDKTACQQHGSGHETLQCGDTDVYIKSECVCTFYNVNEAKYHDHTACPNGENSDDVKRLTCRECALFSLHNKGPCINGGNLTCKTGENVLAPDIQCDCPDDFEGMFCENRMENVTRICDMVTEPSSPQLINCDLTKMDCFTYSENKKYAFKCNKTEESQERK